MTSFARESEVLIAVDLIRVSMISFTHEREALIEAVSIRVSLMSRLD